MRKKIDWRKYTPPGMNIEREKALFVAGLFFSFFYSTLPYIDNYRRAYRRLWKGSAREKILMEGAMIEPFLELLEHYMVGYFLIAACMLALIPVHYAYYRQGSQSIYLVRRLPDRGYLRRTCCTLPLIWTGLSLAAAAVSFICFLSAYLIFTPPECIPPGLF